MKNPAPLVFGEVYLHLCNSGITFRVTDHFGPTIQISSGAFGNIDSTLTVHTNRESMRKVGQMLVDCSWTNFKTEECCCPATIPEPTGQAGGVARASKLPKKRLAEIASLGGKARHAKRTKK